MNSRERLLAASRGTVVDRQPQISWLVTTADSDANVLSEVSKPTYESTVVLAEISNPFGLALKRGINLNKLLKDDPTVGGEILDTLAQEVKGKIVTSLENGADGIFYRLHGASPRYCSPMQYGGHYLELDRELLYEASAASLNVLFIAGDKELYIDFVSDLPAHVFAWDSGKTHISAEHVRATRKGAVASSDPTSEISLLIGLETYLENLEQPNLG